MSVPVDLLLILTSMHADGNQCYIETSNIDGETNLKLREAPSNLLSIVGDGTPTSQMFNGYIEFEPPNKHIHNFVGALHLDSLHDAVPLSAENVLLRGSFFTNTDWAYGVAVYVGQETKLQMNNRHAASKMSTTEKYANTAIKIVFLAQVCITLPCRIQKKFIDFFNLCRWFS